MTIRSIKKSPLYLLVIILIAVFGYFFTNKKANLPDITPQSIPGTVLVTKVIDGDTIELEGGEKVRYIGINTPESTIKHDCFGEEASKKNKELLEGKRVRLESDITDRDKYGRLLRYVYVVDPEHAEGFIFVNETLVRDGYASSYTYPPDVKHQDKFIVAQKEAREANRGLWGKCTNFSVQGDSSIFLDKDCKDFKTEAEAQEFFISNGGPLQDPHNLDTDRDGKVCIRLP